MVELIVATGNRGKLREIKKIVEDLGLDVEVKGLRDISFEEEVPEPGDTFEENALFKARFVANKLNSVVLADDSGLEVDALGGKPGVYSARFSGEGATDEKNNTKLLHMLKGVPLSQRGARFRCVMVLYSPTGDYVLTQGEWRGKITLEPQGENGFGYDPIFFDEELQMTAACMDMETKNSRSHRGQALAKLTQLMEGFFSIL